GVRARVDRRDVDQQFTFVHDGEPWFAAFDTFDVDQDLHWVVGAAAPESDFMGDAARNNVVSLLISAVALGVSLLLAALLASRMSARLTILAEEMERVGQFRLDDAHDLPPTSLREIALMQRALVAMKQGLRSFASYVPRDLVRAVLASGQEAALGGRLR